MKVEINNEGYCKGCTENHNCTNCKKMNILIKKTKKRVFSIITNKKTKKNKKNVQNNPLCGDCSRRMLESKFKNGPAYWCPCSKNRNYF